MANLVSFRDRELKLLQAFITADASVLVPNLVVLGFKSVGKTHTVLRHLAQQGIRHTVINCDEFITQKIMLQKCLHNFRLDSGVDLSTYHQQIMYKGLEAARISLICETFAHFLTALEQFITETGYSEPHVLVLDRFDQCLQHTDDLFRSFLKFREYSTITNVSVVFITSHDLPREIATIAVPHIHFLPYLPEQATQILIGDPFPEVVDGLLDPNFWANFAKLMVDLYFEYTGSDISLLRNICHKTWPMFVEPILEGTHQDTNFLKIYRDIKDKLLQDNVFSSSLVVEYPSRVSERPGGHKKYSDLPHHSKFILIAAYLASYGDPKSDIHLFSRLKSLKKGSPRKNPKSSPSKSGANTPSLLHSSEVDSRLLSAAYFDLERLKAILSVIYRNESKTLARNNQEYFNLYHQLSERDLARKENEFSTFTLNKNVDVNAQIASLVSLGLISRTYALDTLSARIRWKCNVGWDVIAKVAEQVQFPLATYTIDQ